MEAKILVEPSKVWRFYLDELEKTDQVDETLAENSDYGFEIVIVGRSPIGATVEVVADGIVSRTESVDAFDCYEVVEGLYETYMSKDVSGILAEEDEKEQAGNFDGPDSMIKKLDEIDQREEELDFAIYEMLEIFMPDISCDIDGYGTDVYGQLKDLICEWLYKEHGISVYRPMFLVDEDGVESYEEYPYEELYLDED
ncbi:MAG: hypothetical protein LUD69_05810 [Oscillospiraceae bacterium]|nr:hypothetical protein [Oscillospiraceae bacterium]